MAAAVGERAPDATLLYKDFEGNVRKASIHDFITGRKGIILFFPMAGSDHCTQEFCAVSEDLNRYQELGAEVVGISVDNPHAQWLWAKQQGIEVPLLSDFNRQAAKAYGVLQEVFVPGILDMENVAQRATFVVDQNGTIIHREVLDDARDLPDYEAIRAALRG